jgi:di/tricarboxylate transporter
MLAVGFLGSVMSSTGVVAIFIPVVLRIASRSGIAASQLMMPMAYAALISGMMTLVATSPNLVINYEVVRSGAEGFNFFDFTPFGVPILLIGTLYMLVARRWLPAQAPQGRGGSRRPKLRHLVERYRLAEREYRVRVRSDSPLLGRPLGGMDLPSEIGVKVLLIERGRGRARRVLPRTPETVLQPGDILLIDMDRPDADVEALAREYRVDLLPRTGTYFADLSQQMGLVEVMLPYESELVGKTVGEAEQLALSDLSVVGLRRGRKAQEPRHLRNQVLKAGDTLLLAGRWKTIRALQSGGQNLVVLNLPREYDEVLPAGRKAPYAVFTLGVVVTLMATGWVPNVQAALIGCLLMGLFRCIDLEQAYRAIQWKGLIMIVGMLPFALALDRTGGVDLAANAVVALVGEAGPYAILALLYLVTVVLGLFIVNTANAVLLIPIALAVAEELQASPYPFAMIVALGASSAFMTPISPINTLVTTAGNYGFADFIRVGLPLTLIVMVVSVLLVPWLLPLH